MAVSENGMLTSREAINCFKMNNLLNLQKSSGYLSIHIPRKEQMTLGEGWWAEVLHPVLSFAVFKWPLAGRAPMKRLPRSCAVRHFGHSCEACVSRVFTSSLVQALMEDSAKKL
jgi:hypothetical protein